LQLTRIPGGCGGYSGRESDPNKCDFDFGASPNLIEGADNRYVGIGGKDGTYYLLDRLTGRARWATRVVFGGGAGGFFGGAAFDGEHIFSATAFGDGNVNTLMGLCGPGYRDPTNPNVVDTFVQDPSMHAIDALTGSVLWEANNNQSRPDNACRPSHLFRLYRIVGERPSGNQGL